MKKRIFSVLAAMVLLCACLPLCAVSVSAETHGVFTYTVGFKGVTITKCNSSVSGPVEVPATIDGMPVVAIGEYAFDDCIQMSSVVLPEGLTTIARSAFDGCFNLASVNIPDSVVTIEDFAFWCCYALKTVNIPAGVTNIGFKVFSSCEALTAINVDPNNATYTSYKGVLFTKDRQTLVCYPCNAGVTEYTVPQGVTTIEENAFAYCSGLASIVLPNSVTSIGMHAFLECPDLFSVTINGKVRDIVDYTFYGCPKLEVVAFPNTLANVGENAFYECPGFTRVLYYGDERSRAQINIASTEVMWAEWHYLPVPAEDSDSETTESTDKPLDVNLGIIAAVVAGVIIGVLIAVLLLKKKGNANQG